MTSNQEAWRASPSEFERAALELCEQALWIFESRTLRVVWANRAALNVWGVDSVDGLEASDVQSVFAADAMLAERLAQLAAGQTIVAHLTFRARGTPLALRCTFKRMVLNADRAAVLVEGRVVADTPSESEGRFRALCMQAPIGIFLSDIEGRCTFANARCCELAGVSEPEALRGGLALNVHPDDAARVAQEWRRLSRAEREATLQYRYRRENGSDTWVVANILPARDVRGNLTGFLGAMSDVTHSLLSEQRFAAVFEHSTDAHMLIDETGRVIDCNQGAVDLVGAPSKSALLGVLPEQFSPPAPPGVDPHKQVQTFLELATLHGTHRFEWTHERADGRRTVAEVALTCINAGGKRVYFASAHDATERKEAERAIVRSREDALEASRLKSQFLANMSHEIRTPMNGVLGMLHLALGTDLSVEQREFLAAAHASAEGLLEIINDILDLSKIEAGKLKIERVELSIQEILRGSLQGASLRAHAKNLEVVARLDPRLPDVILGDPVRLRQVLTNLLGNAVKFTESGHVAVSLGLLTHGAHQLLTCDVVDTGIGISRDRLGRIFEAFAQADGSTTRRYGGTGLGLTISRELVSMMGGQLSVDSESGRGSRFSFALPFETRTPVVEPPRRTGVEGYHVLVVEDYPLAREVLIGMLEELGAHVISAATPQQALAMLEHEETPVDAGLIDHELGGHNGLELVRALRRLPVCRTTRFTLLRAQERAGRAQLNEAGFAFALDKPVLREDLLRALTAQQVAVPTTSRYMSLPERPVAAPKVPSLSVLVVEDHPVNAHFLSSLLQRQGHRVVHAINGAKALSAFESGSFDVILMDVQMPEMDGLEATRRIRALEQGRGSRVPIIALTANAMKGDQEECLAAGMDHYISKPVDLPQLQAVLARFARPTRPPVLRIEGPSLEGARNVQLSVRLIEPAFQRDELLSRASGDARFMADLIHIFLGSQEEMMRDVESSISGGECGAVRNAAHRLKGALQLVCAMPAATLAKELEQAARAGQPERFQELLRRLAPEMRRLREALGDSCGGR